MTARSKSWFVATAVLVAVFQVFGTFGASNNQPDRRSIDALAMGLVLLGPAALALRDRWPLVAVVTSVVAAQVYIGIGYPYGPIFVSVVIAVFGAVQRGRRRKIWVIVAVSFAGFVVASFVDPRSDGFGWVQATLVAGWSSLVVAVAEVVRLKREQINQREDAARQVDARRADEQRLRLAQDLHDVLAHNISQINVQASVALHLLDEQPENVGPALASIKQASSDALGEIRSALDLLRSDTTAPVSPAPTLADVDDLVTTVGASGLMVSFDAAEPAPPVSAAVQLAAYRIVQEALTNVVRHSGACSASVRVGYDDGVEIEIVDDGHGGVPTPGVGIAGMRERARSMGGTVVAGPVVGGGFRVSARLPCGGPR
ncbi:MAG: histidine kinase [Ilumatobacteraceae bacterium]